MEGLDLGADDYLAEPFSMLEFVARLNAVLRRRGAGISLQTFSDITMHLAIREVTRASVRIELTRREFALLEYLLRSPGRVVTRTEISQSVWGHQFSAGTNFVDVAVQRLRRKVDELFAKKLIQTVRGIGYALQA